MSGVIAALSGKAKAAASGLPAQANLVGLWNGSDFASSTLRSGIPNTATAGATLSGNVLLGTRRLFANGSFWSGSGATVVDNAAVGPDGLTEASTVVWSTGDNNLVANNFGSTPAGTYTFAIDAKTTDASSTAFRMGPFFGTLATVTATPSWQSFSTTFTFVGGDPTLCLRSANTTTPAHLAICNARLFSGSVDLGASKLLQGDMLFVASPTASGGVVTMGVNNKQGVIQLPTATLSQWTVIGVGQSIGATSSNEQAILSKVQSFADFTPLFANGDRKPGALFAGGDFTNNASNMWNYQDNDGVFHAVGNRYNGASVDLFMEDVLLSSKASVGQSVSIGDLLALTLQNGNSVANYKWTSIVLYNTALTNAQMTQAATFLKSQAQSASLTLGYNRFICADGDSITFGQVAPSFMQLFPPNSSPSVQGENFAISGSVLADVVSREAVKLAMLPTSKAGREFVYSLLIGTNDLQSYPGGPTQYAADVSAHMGRMKAGGYDKTVLITVLPNTGTGFNAVRDTLNTIYRGSGWAAAHNVDAICDFAADPVMGIDGNGSTTGPWNQTNYAADGTHPTAAGYAILEPIYRAALNGLT